MTTCFKHSQIWTFNQALSGFALLGLLCFAGCGKPTASSSNDAQTSEPSPDSRTDGGFAVTVNGCEFTFEDGWWAPPPSTANSSSRFVWLGKNQEEAKQNQVKIGIIAMDAQPATDKTYATWDEMATIGKVRSEGTVEAHAPWEIRGAVGRHTVLRRAGTSGPLNPQNEQVIIHQWYCILDDRHVTISTSCYESRAAELLPAFERIASTLTRK